MTSEVHNLQAQAKLGINLPHCCFLGVNALKCFGVVQIHVGHKGKKIFVAPFIKQAQQFFRRQSEPVKMTQQIIIS